MSNPYPDVFLVGAPKCGTTSMYEYFAQHPQMFVPELKEPHFFSMPEVANGYYDVKLVSDDAEYQQMYAVRKDGQLGADCSPSYLCFEKACERIHAANPEAKIVAVLRDPVKRAISHYQMDVRFGVQQIQLSDCLANPEEHPIAYREYVGNGLYADQIQRYWDRFSKDQVKIFLFEDLNSDTAGVMRDLFDFIGVKSDVSIDFNQRANVGAQHRYGLVKRFVYSGGWKVLRGLIPSGLKSRMRKALTEETSKAPNLDAEKSKLAEIFRPDIDRLAKMIGRDLSTWAKA